MAAVYEAYDPALERAVALKVLPPEFLHDESFTSRFRQEGRVVARLEHPNIVPIYSNGIDDGIAWMNMRLLTGGSLGALLRRERPTPQRIVQILRSVADALDYAHARGVIHRDIKPANILFDQTDHVCVADFGIAYMTDFTRRHTSVRTIVGTPEYMAPEASLGRAIDHRCDIYSLGVVAYEMLSGERPFTADGPMAILLKHVNDDPPWPATVPVPLLHAVHKALAKDPAERWSSAGAFAAAMEAGLGAGTSPRIPFVPRWIAIAGSALAIAVTVFLTLLRDQPRSAPAVPADAPPPSTIQSASAVAPRPTEPTPPGIPGRRRVVLEQPTPKRTASSSGVASAASGESGDVPSTGPQQTVPAPTASPDVPTASPPPPETSPPPPVAEFDLPVVERVAPDDVLVQPIRIKTVAAAYPPVARAAQIVGNVVLHATVGLDGAVSDVAVVRSVHPLLDQAATQAVLQYRYTPAMRNAVPEIGTVEITVSFRLE